MTIEKEIILILNDYISNPLEKEKFSREHIFYDIKNIIKKSLSENQLIDIYYHFSLYEKCLNLSRNNQLNLSNYWVDYATKLYSELPNSLKEPLGLLYYPMIAYNHYVKKEYDLALSFLKMELIIIENYIKDEALKLEFKLEQLANIYRIAFAKNDIQEIESYGSNILSFIILNQTSSDFFTENNKFSLLDKNNKTMWIDYMINIIISKTVGYEKSDLINRMFIKLKNKTIINSNINETETLIDIILSKNFIENDFCIIINNLNTYQNYLQLLILEKIKLFKFDNFELISVIDAYVKNVLNIYIKVNKSL
ncbi:hypothetical protein [Flavobacterium psychrophilum]|uniref:hypothetical protein n=1 Tax=Flavobacterium psychrophilum TaxID=96345 RepID=UPI00106CD6A1|nr:hypothetical protein [Flavobacterium psychrophilum]